MLPIGGLDPDDVVTAWVALSDAPVESGAMEFLPGSHRAGQLPHADTFHEHNLLSRGQEIAVKVDAEKAVKVPLQAGEMSLHHVKLAHYSGPNTTPDRRIGLAIRYIPPHVRQLKVRDSASLVRGRDTGGHYDLEPRPLADLDAAAWAAHRDAVARQVAALYSGTEKTGFRA
ncbi:phytanoyl-CoA dioxygenase family protein [Siccirubricoccus sp. G192]|uniref:phytanoyl-CoA dioxygenase family protein n=1 Tax=Siccirubricoccus sp. G192 TaxID=2849651 RepID=UPI001C2B7B2C|nr:phytanoyl-CoA dioxygenase family protein [Siccirubricoccus sp. G192]MBV1797038.1 phytanoyl-CoA dioxygenase family protein [Siccirubricoccus sp. G192]